MTVSEVKASVGLDVSALRRGVQEGKAATADFGAHLQRTLEESAKRATSSLDGVLAKARALGPGLAVVSNAAKTVSSSLDPMNQRLKESGTLMTKLGDSAAAVGRKMTTGFTLPFLALGANAVRVQASLEDSLNQLRAATGANVEQMAALSARAVALGKDLQLPATSAVSAAQAELELARAGMNTADIMAAVRPAMLLSAAAHISNADSARMLAVAENQFGIAAKDSAKAADILTAASQRTVGGANALFQGLKQVGPVMAGLRVPFGDAVTALALLQRNGLQASVAGAALKTSLSLIADPSKKARAVLEVLGIQLFDATGKFVGMGRAAEILHDRLGKLTDAQRLMAEHALAGTRGMLALNILAREGGAGFAEMAGKVNKAGEAARQASEQMKGLPGALRVLQTSFTAASQAAIEPLSKDLARLGRAAGELLTRFASLPEGTRRAIVEFGLVTAAIGPMLIMVGRATAAVGALTKGLAEVKAGVAIAQMTSTGAALKTMGNLFNWAKGIIAGFVAYLGGPVIAALVAVAAAVTAFATVWTKNLFRIQEQFRATWETVTQIFAAVQSEVSTAWVAFTDLLQGRWFDAWTNMKAVVTDVMGFIAKVVTNPVGAVQDLLTRQATNFAEQMAQSGPTTAPAAPRMPNLGAPSVHRDFAGPGTFNSALAAIGQKSKKSKEAEPTSPINDNLNAFIADNLARIALLKKRTGDDAIEIIRQFAPIHDRRIQEAIDSDRTRKALEKEAQVRKDFVETLVKQARESYVYQSNDATGRLRFTQDQRQAMLDTGKTFDKLTEAELKEAHAYLQRQRILNTNKSIDAYQTEQKQKLVSATWESWKALDATNKAWEAFASGNKYATEVLQRFGVVLKDLPKKDQGLIIGDIINGDKKTAAMAAYQDFASGVTGIFDTMFNNIHNGFKSAFQSVVGGFEDLLRNMAAKYLASQLAHLFLGALGSAFGGKAVFADILGGLEGKASGGLVSQDTPYLVGERGPELFMPNRPGRIVPNGELAGAAAAPININFTVHATDAQSFKRSQHQIVADLNRASREASRRSGR
jgi:TP901 family phage tail tape measure protein